MRPLPRVPSRAAAPLRRAAVALCLVLALVSWLDGSAETAPASDRPARLGAGEAATSVRVFAEVARLVRPGDSIDLVAPGGPDAAAGRQSAVIARAVRVLRASTPDAGFGAAPDVAVLVVAASREVSVHIASAVDLAPFAVVVTP